MENAYKTIHDDGETGLSPDVFEATRDRIEEAIELPRYYDVEEASGYKGYKRTPDTKQ